MSQLVFLDSGLNSTAMTSVYLYFWPWTTLTITAETHAAYSEYKNIIIVSYYHFAVVFLDLGLNSTPATSTSLSFRPWTTLTSSSTISSTTLTFHSPVSSAYVIITVATVTPATSKVRRRCGNSSWSAACWRSCSERCRSSSASEHRRNTDKFHNQSTRV